MADCKQGIVALLLHDAEVKSHTFYLTNVLNNILNKTGHCFAVGLGAIF